MYLGKLVELVDSETLFQQPRHPYSIALLSAVPHPDPRVHKKRLVLAGDVPSPANPPSGCRFHTRCWLRERLGNPENCSSEDPVLRDVGDGHAVACHHADQITEATVRELVPIVAVDGGHISSPLARLRETMGPQTTAPALAAPGPSAGPSSAGNPIGGTTT
jgi:peptide/nickel transport system ATP-binding protein